GSRLHGRTVFWKYDLLLALSIDLVICQTFFHLFIDGPSFGKTARTLSRKFLVFFLSSILLLIGGPSFGNTVRILSCRLHTTWWCSLDQKTLKKADYILRKWFVFCSFSDRL
ncbi:hypothetical protein HAX54_040434, partial [Datura stramonium]|nr:hypothetical protein [Datura stramonium]